VKKESRSSNSKKAYLGLLAVPIIAFLLLSKVPKTLNNSKASNKPVQSVAVAGVYEQSNTQYVDLKARGGYFPASITAKANMPTILRVTTSNTFDCSSAISIPSLGYRKNLPSTGTTEITIPAQEPNTEINGTCAMGMYDFKIVFN
jgi:plastocyanin domain-containing protein